MTLIFQWCIIHAEVIDLYKTELHAHTCPASKCAHTEPEEMIEQYIENGYSAVVITNHMSPTLFDVILPDITDYREAAEIFLEDIRRARVYAAGRITVLTGMELRVRKNMNDYLIYGIDDEFILNMGNVMDMTIKELSPFFHENGALIFQAHPFRDTMTVTSPKLLDGIEAGNFCTTHDSRNDIAAVWAKKFGMLTVYGSDYHSKAYMRGAGILTEQPITCNAELLNVLKTKSFKVTDGENVFLPY